MSHIGTFRTWPASHRGRIVKTTGDGMLVEFASAVDAVRSGLEVQRRMAERNGAVSSAVEGCERRGSLDLRPRINDQRSKFTATVLPPLTSTPMRSPGEG
jgi:hypothetical protein